MSEGSMNPKIKAIQDLLDALATAGGNIVTLFWCSAFSGLLWAWMVMRHETNMVTPTFGVFTGFTGALLQAQKGNSSRQQMVDRVEAAVPGTVIAAQTQIRTADTPTEPAAEK